MKWKFIMLVMVLIFSVSSVKANENSINDYFEKARGELLGFYNSEIVSHAGLILGFFVASATLVSNWKKFLEKDKPSWKKGLIFFFIISLTIGLTIYAFGRLIYWSGLDAYVIRATPEDVTTYLKANITTSNVTSWVSLLHNYTMKSFESIPIRWLEPQYWVAQYAVLVSSVLVSVLTSTFFLIWWLRKGPNNLGKENRDSGKPSSTLEKRMWYTQLSKPQALALEYQELTKSIWNRGRDYFTLQSILISGSLLAVSYVARNISEMNMVLARMVLLGSIFLIILAFIFYYTTSKVNIIFWDRVHEIEDLLGIKVGHHGIYNRIKNEGWFKLRRYNWEIIFGFLILFYVIALIWTFY